MTATALPRTIDPDRVAALMERERARYRERTARSGEYFARAATVMPGGVPSQFQKNDPWPVYVERGHGAHVTDVDGNEYLDFHNGFGVMCVGHANPVVAAAVKAQMDHGTHFAAPMTGSIVVAEELVAELQEHCKRTTAPYKFPRIVEFADELPKTASGKIKRAQLRDP